MIASQKIKPAIIALKFFNMKVVTFATMPPAEDDIKTYWKYMDIRAQETTTLSMTFHTSRK